MTPVASVPDGVDVAIVGAGPVGLALAIGLGRHGVRSVVLEKRDTPNEQSRAPVIHVRTREVLRKWGVEERFVREGELRRQLSIVAAAGRSRSLLSVDFSELDDEARDPGFLFLEQGRTERLLIDAIVESGLSSIRFGSEVTGLEANSDSVTLQVGEGTSASAVRTRYVVGCDGAGSFVRSALGLPFDGITYAIRPMLADVRVSDERDALPWPRLLNDGDGVTFSLRLSDSLWRIIRLERGESSRGDTVSEEEVRRHATSVLGRGPIEIVWSSRFRIHRRSSPRFRVGRVLLAGDAAHVHSPAGGLGMNGGVQDAHNLAWKLAAALRGGDVDRLLDSYDVERRAVVVESTSRYTDLLTRAFVQTPAAVRAGGLAIARVLLRSRRARRRFLRRSTMLDLDYPTSPLLERGDRGAGVRLPDVLLRPPAGAEVRLHDLLPPAPAIIALSDEAEAADGLPVEHVVRVGAGAFRDVTSSLRRLAGGRDGWILVRPDGHVAWVRDRRDGMAGAVRRALGQP